MNALDQAYLAGALVSGMTWGTLKIIWKYAIRGE